MSEEGPLQRLKAAAGLIYDEYITCESSADAAMSVDELHAGARADALHPELVKRILLLAMDKNDKERRMADVLLSSLVVRGSLEPQHVEAGLEQVLSSLETLEADVPKCVEYTAEALAHLIEDKVVPESMLTHMPVLAGDRLSPKVLSQVQGMLDLPLPITKFKAAMRPIVDEYFINGDVREACEQLADLKEKRFGHVVVKRIIAVALEKKNAEREMASVLLSGLTKVYGSEQFFEGFIRTLRGIDDLELDTPNVCPLVASFIARAIIDDVLPPVFLSLVPKRVTESGRGKEVAALVTGLMEQHSSTRIMNVWGIASRGSVDELKQSVATLVEEYYVEGELEEAVRCVQDLGVPHFGHEVVKKLVYRAVEKGEKHMRMAIALIKELQKTEIMDHMQLTKGMSRAVMGLPDFSLDVPDAPERLRTLADWLCFEGLLSPSFKQACLRQSKEHVHKDAEATVERVHMHAEFMVEEFLVCESGRDAAASVEDFGARQMHPELVRKMLTLSMDKPDKERDMIRALVSSLVVRGALEASEVEAGMDLLLRSIEDLQIDVPLVVDYTAHVVAHFLEDKTIPESFLSSVPLLCGEAVGKRLVDIVGKQLQLPLPITVVKKQVDVILSEFFINPDPAEAVTRLAELKENRFGHVVVKRIVAVALEKKNAEREMASVLLSGLTKVYGSEQFFEGFIRTLRGIDDLALDTPNVCPLVANFIARAIIDDVLPPVFLSLVPKRLIESGRGKEVAALVTGLMEQHSSTRIMNVWGIASRGSVDELKQSVATLVEEYYVEGELEEAVRCVQDLGVPHFGHEVVKKLVYRAVEKGGEAIKQANALLKALVAASALERSELTKGMSRVVRGLPDLSLDVPDAAKRIDAVIETCVADGILDKGFVEHTRNMASSIAQQ